MSQKSGGPAPEMKPVQDAQAELEQLRATVARQQAQIDELLAAGRPAADAKLPAAKAGHVWCYTRYPYVVEKFENGKFRPETVGRDQAVEVTELELKIDRLRRYPHLETVEAREMRLHAAQERTTRPIREHMDNLAGAFADAAERVTVRDQHRAATLAAIMDPARLAGQLPE